MHMAKKVDENERILEAKKKVAERTYNLERKIIDILEKDNISLFEFIVVAEKIKYDGFYGRIKNVEKLSAEENMKDGIMKMYR
jgi:hypothetical protein